MQSPEFVNPKNPVIVFDLDDTLVDTSHVYWTARTMFEHAMVTHGMDASKVIQKFEELDGQNMKAMGFAPERYGKSMRDTYKWFINISNLIPSPKLEKLIDDAGNLIFVQMPELIDGSIELLEWCSTRYDLVLLTRGLQNLQMKKLLHNNLNKYFGIIKIVSEKGAPEFKEIIKDAGHTLDDAWVIGDSIKSDINPGLEIGLKCILFVYAHDTYYWQQEYGHSPKGYFYRITSLVDAIKVLQQPDLFEKVSDLS